MTRTVTGPASVETSGAFLRVACLAQFDAEKAEFIADAFAFSTNAGS
jgi:hypothetical protein